MTALIATGVVLSGLAGLLPFVTTDQLNARIIPVEEEVTDIESKLDKLIRLDREDRISRVEQELREIDRSILEAKSRIDNGEGNRDTELLIQRLERDERSLNRQLDSLRAGP